MFYVIQTASLTDLESPQNPHLLAPAFIGNFNSMLGKCIFQDLRLRLY